jgi:CelD/BcsL family acetyltransferase involved in cellulose biosynthesis
MAGVTSELLLSEITWQDAELAVWREWSSQTMVSPFQTPTYLQLFAEQFLVGQDVRLICVKLDDQPVAFGGFVMTEGMATALGMQLVDGEQEISDYFDLVFRENSSQAEIKAVWQTVLVWLQQQGATSVQLDYVSDQGLSYQALQAPLLSQSSPFAQQEAIPLEVAPAVSLPTDWPSFVSSLKKKHRDELKRKLRRLAELQPRFEFGVAADDTSIADFIRLHRLADGAKQQFMTDKMAEFFTQLATAQHDGGWQWRFAFVSLAGKRVAAVAYFTRSSDSLLLYNSGYDPEFRSQGVGFGLVARLLEHAISEQQQRFDFLRGSERYKYELGGVDQQLWRLSFNLSA